MAYGKRMCGLCMILFIALMLHGCSEQSVMKEDTEKSQVAETPVSVTPTEEKSDVLQSENIKKKAESLKPQKVITPTPESEKAKEDKITALLEEMTLEEKIAQMFFITPDALTGISGTQMIGDITKEQFGTYPVGGFVFFDSNIQSPEQIIQMNSNLTEISLERIGIIPFLGVDEEGGTVLRIADNPAFPQEDIGNMSAIGAVGDISKAYQIGAYLGEYLKEYGFNVEFAPVADVWNNPENTVVKERSFGSEPKSVAEMVREETKGIQKQGISAVLKHFPGHGATTEDSHNGSAVSNRSLEQLRAEEFLPFASGIAAGADFVMTGHIIVPEITGDMPASLSAAVITDLLREELGFQGITVTDAMNMQSVTDSYSSAEAAVLAIQAGTDMILMPEDFRMAYEGVCNAVYNGEISEEKINESVTRILRVKLEKQDFE